MNYKTVLFVFFVFVGLAHGINQVNYLADELAQRDYSWYGQVACNPADLTQGLVDAQKTYLTGTSPFTDMTLGLEKTDMEDIVDIINTFRQEFAEGIARDSTGAAFPQATDMAMLRRSPDLECSALRWINVYRNSNYFDTTKNFPTGLSYYLGRTSNNANGIFQIFYFYSKPSYAVAPAIVDYLADPTKVTKSKVDGTTSYGNSDKLIISSATRIGCSILMGWVPYSTTRYYISYFDCLLLNEENFPIVTNTYIYKHEPGKTCGDYTTVIPEHSQLSQDEFDRLCAYTAAASSTASTSTSSSTSTSGSTSTSSTSTSTSSTSTSNSSTSTNTTTSTGTYANDTPQSTYLVSELKGLADSKFIFSTNRCNPSALKSMWTAAMNTTVSTKSYIKDESALILGYTYKESVGIIDRHNEVRELAAEGIQGASAKLSPGKDIPLVRRDPILECDTLSYLLYMVLANGPNNLVHSSSDMRKNAGENIAATWTTSLDGAKNYDAVGSWYEEKDVMNDNLLTSYVFGTGDQMNGHFTAETWHYVTRVGCSRIVVPKEQTGSSYHTGFILCQYTGEEGVESSSQPNFSNVKVYDISSTATCGNVKTTAFTQRGYDSRYPNLCGNPNLTIEKLQ